MCDINTKFRLHQDKINTLRAHYPRFERIYTEYEMMEQQFSLLENSDDTLALPDDFINAIALQISYLEDEIEDWLLEERGAI